MERTLLLAVAPDTRPTPIENFGRFDTSELIANGYNVFNDLLIQQSVTAFGYVVVFAVLGYFFLRTREIAA